MGGEDELKAEMTRKRGLVVGSCTASLLAIILS